MSKLKFLVIHCTDTPAKREIYKKDIEQWHLKERGWSRVGYSDLIQLDGTLVNLVTFDQDDTVDRWEVTNGVKGFNGLSRHIVYAGGAKCVDTRTYNQKYTLEIYVRYMILRHPKIKVIGHNQLAKKYCPSFDVNQWLNEIGVLNHNRLIG